MTTHVIGDNTDYVRQLEAQVAELEKENRRLKAILIENNNQLKTARQNVAELSADNQRLELVDRDNADLVKENKRLELVLSSLSQPDDKATALIAGQHKRAAAAISAKHNRELAKTKPKSKPRGKK
jgi:septal ring factor EnvC (AmiA/AmiB activator)